jgi:glycosyltransferase involved in cell wall biosynthesis
MTLLVARASIVLACLLLAGWSLALVRVFRTMVALRKLPTTTTTDVLPSVTAIVAARDEDRGIRASLLSLLAQEGVTVDVVVVDDGSTDNTAAEVSAVVAAHPGRVLLLSSKKIPPGWVAKNYALELGQGRARGDFLLFSDADVLHGARAVRHALQVMVDEKLDHLTVHPRLEAGSWIEALVLPLFVLLCQIRFIDPRAAAPTSNVGAGIGAFNMVRADAYRLRGTHARIRGALLDDKALGKMMRDEAGRGSLMRAGSQVRLRPYHSTRDLYVGIRKTVLSTFDHSALLTAAMGGVLLFAAIAPAALVLLGVPLWMRGQVPWGVIPAAVAVLLPMIGLLRARPILRFEPVAALLFPVGAVVIAASALEAALVFLVRGTILWRGRTYTKRDLENDR